MPSTLYRHIGKTASHNNKTNNRINLPHELPLWPEWESLLRGYCNSIRLDFFFGSKWIWISDDKPVIYESDKLNAWERGRERRGEVEPGAWKRRRGRSREKLQAFHVQQQTHSFELSIHIFRTLTKKIERERLPLVWASGSSHGTQVPVDRRRFGRVNFDVVFPGGYRWAKRDREGRQSERATQRERGKREKAMNEN